MFRLISVLLIVALTPGCATIRSRDLTPTADAPRIQNDEFYRGDEEKLDEQEFYQLIGDRESYDAIRGPRLAAQNTQFLWVALTLIGVAAAGFGAANMLLPRGGPLGDNGLFQPLFPNPADGSFNYIPYAITAGGAVLFGIGVALLSSSASRVNPTELKFDIFHAKESARKFGFDPDAPAPNSYEGKLLAERKKFEAEELARTEERKKLKRSDVATIELKALRDTFSFEAVGSIDFRLLNAKGEFLDFLSTEGWLEWSSTPAGFVDDTGKWTNPQRADLKYLGVPLVITAKLKETNVTASITLKPDLTSPASIVLSDGSAASGESGSTGRSGTSSSPRGQNGQHGTHGKNGRDGRKVYAEAAFVQDQRGESYLLVVSGRPGALDWDLTDGKRARIAAVGESGGRGGSGGSGGRGYDAYKDCESPGDGGDGGDGGNGGNGGNGPSLVVEVPSQAVADQLELRSEAGAAGAGGSAGSAGYAGTSHWCSYARETFKGKSGRAGRDGSTGQKGSPGDTDFDIVPKKELDLINAFLKENPSMRFDDDGLDADEVPSKKKGKKAR